MYALIKRGSHCRWVYEKPNRPSERSISFREDRILASKPPSNPAWLTGSTDDVN